MLQRSDMWTIFRTAKEAKQVADIRMRDGFVNLPGAQRRLLVGDLTSVAERIRRGDLAIVPWKSFGTII